MKKQLAEQSQLLEAQAQELDKLRRQQEDKTRVGLAESKRLADLEEAKQLAGLDADGIKGKEAPMHCTDALLVVE